MQQPPFTKYVYTAEMQAMIPSFLPARERLVYLTGVIEIAAAVGLMIPRLQRITGIALIAFLFAVLPANIYAALNYAGMGNHVNGPAYLRFRLPLQFFFIWWAWEFTLRV